MTPRIVLAAPNSSSGKTTVAIGLMAALRARGLEVAPFKVGPDYIDPGYHAVATGRPGRNLDPWLTSEELIAPLFVHGAQGADVAVVEGVMGLYDGRMGLTNGRRGFGSTAHVAELIDAPVVLVVDVSGTSRTIAATAYGLAHHPAAPQVAGVICNKVSSPRLADELRDAFAEVGLPVLGMIGKRSEVKVASRHLGLVPAAERGGAEEVVASAAELIAGSVDLDAIMAIAREAAQVAAEPWKPTDLVERVDGNPTVAIAGGRAFTFRYPENTELLEAAGCRVVEFDPLSATELPDCDGLLIGGGFPEMHAEELAANASLMASARDQVAAGLPTVAECAGLLYLCRSLDQTPMTRVLPADAAMAPKLTMGYRELVAVEDSVITRTGESARSHEFHRTQVTGADPDAWRVNDTATEGFATPTLLATYQHLHWAGNPQWASRFAQAASDHQRARSKK